MKLLQLIIATLLLTPLIYCTNNEEKPLKKKVFYNGVYRLYSISGAEDEDWVNCYLQFRSGKNGYSIVLDQPEEIYFDNKLLVPDSTLEKEYFYELQLPAAGFAGRHTITYEDKNGEQYADEFMYTPFSLTTELTDRVSRKNLVLELAGLEEGEELRVVMTDTSFQSKGINEFYPVANGQLDLRPHLKDQIKNGPVVLQLFKEQEKPLQSSSANGEISITYALKREFELKD